MYDPKILKAKFPHLEDDVAYSDLQLVNLAF